MAPELPEALREVAERAVNVLAPETDLFEDMDSAGFGDALTKALRSAVTHPVQPAKSAVHLATDLVKFPLVAGARWFGREVEPRV
jgi:polyhydroxyalkanoate synthase